MGQMVNTSSGDNLLSVNELVVEFPGTGSPVRAVDGVSFAIPRGGTVGLVGESGCGKSVTSMAIMQLISRPGRIASGSIRFDGTDLLGLGEAGMRKCRGNRISMIFQEPMTSLNPVFPIGEQVGEVFRIHQGASKSLARERAIEMLRMVRIPSPETRVDEYPHQLSGGMRQRVMIAMALACRPELLIADEPTTALDVTIQAQILELMSSLQREMGTSILLITHDLGVVAEVCKSVVVMYAGRIVEKASVQDIFANAAHPYTRGLLNSIPRLGRKVHRLPAIEGSVPEPGKVIKGCRFRDRCKLAVDKCASEQPNLTPFGGASHEVACWRAGETQ
ncbi:MAG: hypothetical protein RIQ81_944 [Pseudomonadota bacterium]